MENGNEKLTQLGRREGEGESGKWEGARFLFFHDTIDIMVTHQKRIYTFFFLCDRRG